MVLAHSLGVSHTELDKSLKSLLADDYLVLTVIERKLLELTEEGALYASKGTPEFQYASALPVGEPIEKAKAEELVGKEVAKIGFAKAMQRKWIAIEGDKKDIVRRIADKLDDQEKEQLEKYQQNTDYEQHDKKVIEGLKKRKLVNVITQKSYRVVKGTNFAPVRVRLETDISADMIRTGAWKDAKFKKFNFNSQG